MRIRLNLPIAGLMAMILIMVGIAWAQTQAGIQPDPAELAQRCTSCHLMDNHVATWQASPHNQVACVACHADPGLWGWAHQRWERARMEWEAKLAPDRARAVSAAVPNERCTACHAAQMPYVMQDLKPPPIPPAGGPVQHPPREQIRFLSAAAAHDQHLNGPARLQCTDCHNGVSHAPPGTEQRRDVAHDTCQSCHTRERVAIAVPVPVSCAACHVDLGKVTPEDHKAPAWRDNHGQDALRGVSTCAACHLIPGMGPVPLAAPAHPETAQAARPAPAAPAGNGNGSHGSPAVKPPPAPMVFPPELFPPRTGVSANACNVCHGTVMPHPDGWLAGHSTQARADTATCAQCHDVRGTGTGGNPPGSAPACLTCHTTPMPHPAGWPAQHGQAARAPGANCTTCHSPANPVRPAGQHAAATFCTSCHAGQPMPHPAGFAARHGDAALQAGQAACATCHSPANQANRRAPHAAATFCTDCHAGQAMPHPDGFAARHGEAALQAGPATCAACHSPANPANRSADHAATTYCTACHAQPMPHPDGWAQAHGTAARLAGTTCAACHSPANPVNRTANHAAGPAYCLGCHLQTFRHPAGFVATHQQAVGAMAGAGTAGCLTCHTTAAGSPNSCAACHTGGAWHPDPFWFVKHGQVARSTRDGDCLACHGYVEPNCATCHRAP